MDGKRKHFAAALAAVMVLTGGEVALSAPAGGLSVLVRVAPGVDRERLRGLAVAHGATDARPVVQGRGGRPLGRPLDRWYRLDVPTAQAQTHVLRRVLESGDIEQASLPLRLELDAAGADPELWRQWGLVNTGQVSEITGLAGIAGADVGAAALWDSTETGLPVVVAVIDSGIDYRHPDLAGRIWSAPGELPGNGLDDDGNGHVDDLHGYDFFSADADPMDEHGHGTHVAGIIAAERGNAEGVAGIADGARLMALRAFHGSGTDAAVAAAVAYAIDNGARIINASFGADGYSPLLADAMAAAGEAGVLVVASAGNSALDTDRQPHYPSSLQGEHIIAVAATDRFDARAAISSYGAQSVDLGAPGDEVFSTYTAGRYAYMSGTSMAAPHVSGAAAVVLGLEPDLDPRGVRERLFATADANIALAGMTATGARLNVGQAAGCETSAPLQARWIGVEQGEPLMLGMPAQLRTLVTHCGRGVVGAAVTVFDPSGAVTEALAADDSGNSVAAAAGVYTARWTPTTLGEYALVLRVDHALHGVTERILNVVVYQPVAYRHAAIAFDWIDGGAELPTGADGSVEVELGFTFDYFGRSFERVRVLADGYLQLAGPHWLGAGQSAMPDPAEPNGVIAPLWQAMEPGRGRLRVSFDGVAPQRRATFTWEDVEALGGSDPVSFQVSLMEGSGEIDMRWRDVDFHQPGLDAGRGASVGIESADGLDGLRIGHRQPVLASGAARRLFPAAAGAEVAHRIEVDLTPVRGLAGALLMDFIDADGRNGNQVKLLEFASDGDFSLGARRSGDAAGGLLPGPGRLGDAVFFSELAQGVAHGSRAAFVLHASGAGPYTPGPDGYALYVVDAAGMPFPTTDPLGTDALVAITINGPQPEVELYDSAYAKAAVEILGAPRAVINGPAEGWQGVALRFDGSGSRSPSGAPLSYAWDFGDGNRGAGVAPQHVFARPGVYTVRLTVDDGVLRSLAATAAVTVRANHAPHAQAGADQRVYGPGLLDLDGSASFDPDGTLVTYRWTQRAGQPLAGLPAEGVRVALPVGEVAVSHEVGIVLEVVDDAGASGHDALSVWLYPHDADDDADGLPDRWEWQYFASLAAQADADADGDGLSNAEEYRLGTDPLTPEPPPVASPRVTLTPLDGAVEVNWDAVAGATGYAVYWSQQSGFELDAAVRLVAGTGPFLHAGLTNGQSYYYRAAAFNGSGEGPASAELAAVPGAAPAAVIDGPATAAAGQDLVFDGRGSSDPNGHALSYSWEFGDGVTAEGAVVGHRYQQPGAYEVELRVSAGGRNSAVTVHRIQVDPNALPVAVAGADQVVLGGSPVLLDGSASSDADGPLANAVWSQVAGGYVELYPEDALRARFVAPLSAEAPLRFRLQVWDSAGAAAGAETTVTVLDAVTDTDADGLPDAWERHHFGALGQGADDDPDADALTNAQELGEGTDPNVPAPVPGPIGTVQALADQGRVVVLWPRQAGVIGYRVEWGLAPGFVAEPGRIAERGVPVFEHAGLADGEPVYYRVNAYNLAGSGPVSAEVMARPEPRQWGGFAALDGGLGGARDADIALEPDASAWLAWAQTDSAGDTLQVRRRDSGGVWSDAETVSEAPGAVHAPRLAFDPASGSVLLVWLRHDGTRYNLWSAQRRPGLGWSPPELLEHDDGGLTINGDVGSVSAPTLAINRHGEVMAVWTQGQVRWIDSGPGWRMGAVGTVVYANTFTPGRGWGGRQFIDINDSDRIPLADPPAALLDDAGNATVVWRRDTRDGGLPRTQDIYANRYRPGIGWLGAERVVSDDPLGAGAPGRPALAMDGAGRVTLAWLRGGVWAAQFTRERGWEAPRLVARTPRNGWVSSLSLAAGGDAVSLGWVTHGNRLNEASVAHRVADGGWTAATSVASVSAASLQARLIQGHHDTAQMLLMSDGELRLARSQRGVWQTPEPVPRVAGGWLSDLRAAVSPVGGLGIVWLRDSQQRQLWTQGHFSAPRQPDFNIPPIADAGADTGVAGTAAVTLDGERSYDPDGRLVGYRWRQTAGPAVALECAYRSRCEFAAPVVKRSTRLEFELEVTDAAGAQAVDTVSVTVTK